MLVGWPSTTKREIGRSLTAVPEGLLKATLWVLRCARSRCKGRLESKGSALDSLRPASCTCSPFHGCGHPLQPIEYGKHAGGPIKPIVTKLQEILALVFTMSWS